MPRDPMQTPVPPVLNNTSSGDRGREFILLGIILAFTLAVHARTFSFGFVYDDVGQIVENHFVKSWEFAPQFFTMHVWKELHPVAPGNYYRPLFLFWLLGNYSLFGLEPAGWHVTAVLLHLLVTGLAFLVIRKLTGSASAAGIAALLFGVHPVHLEVTAWVSGVTESLYTTPFLAGFLAYLKSREGNRAGWMALSLACYGAALMGKETAIILPVMIFAHAWIYDPGENNAPARALAVRLEQGFWAVAAYLPVAVLYLCLRIFALQGFGHETEHLTPATIVLTWPSVLAFYLRLLVWPTGLSEFYPLRYYDHVELMGVLVPFLVVLATVGALWYWQHRSKSREVKLALVWLGVPLLPLLNLSIFSWRDFAHDRYLYLPSIGFVLLGALGLEKLFAGGGQILGCRSRPLAAAGAIAALLAFGTWDQSQYWANEYNLYTRALSIAPENPTAANNLATVYMHSGREAEAFALYRRVIQIKPDSWYANYNLGFLAYKNGKYDEATDFLLRGTQIDPFEPDQYALLGKTYFRMGKTASAVAALERAIALKPQAPGYHIALGVILAQAGDCGAARAHFAAELKNNPSDAKAKELLGNCEQLLPGHAPAAVPAPR